MGKITVGGQAVIEGVMMKSPKYYSVAVRKDNKKISSKAWRYISLGEKYKILKLPFLRGVINLWEMLRLGMGALTYSAKESGEEDEELSDFAITMTVIISLLMAVGLFVVLPYVIPHLLGISEEKNTILFNAVDGFVKILLFVGYVYLISLMDDIKRVFQYHGAEHMAVNCYENNQALTPKNVMKYPTYHPRCGTSFIVFVLITMIIVFSFIPLIVKGIFPGIDSLGLVLKKLILFLVRLLFILPVAGISYEILRLNSKIGNNFISRLFAFPGKLVQKITTRRPSLDQLEVSIAALKAVLKKENSNQKNS
ncbi:MAG: DUF1385 domain-containing protein [Nanobdellota archaeon]